MAKVTVVRITRHDVVKAQMIELNRIFGEVDVFTIPETMPSDTRAFVARFDELTEGAEVCEAVLPVNLMEAVLKFTQFAKAGGQLIRSVMTRIPRIDSEGKPVLNDRGEPEMDFIFDHYERIEKVEIISTRL